MLTAKIAIAVGLACVTGYRGISTLLTRKAARATLIYDGYRKARELADGAFVRDRAPPMPAIVEDRVRFTDENGNEITADIRRFAVAHESSLVVWYDPRQPRRVTAHNPFVMLGLGLTVIGLAVWSAL